MSVHMFGLALDLDCADVNEVVKLTDLIEHVMPEVRMGSYTKKGTFVHFDLAYHIIPRMSDAWVEGMRWGE